MPSDVAQASELHANVSLAMSYTLHGLPSEVQDSLVPYQHIGSDLMMMMIFI